MQFIDLHAQYEALKEGIDAGISRVLENGSYIMGPEVAQLEGQLAEYVGVGQCVTCGNGTDALELSLLAWGVGEGDAVFVPSFTFMSTAEVVAYLGATPVFVDVDGRTFNMDASSLEQSIEHVEAAGRLRPAAVVTVDLFGLPADYDDILPIARKHGLKVLEDGAQGFGGSLRGRKACSFGDVATTSFFPAKPLGCYGDGGAVFTNDAETADLLRSLRVHGKGSQKYDNVRIGRNSRLDSIQAAILQVKLRAFAETELRARNEAASYYTERLSGSFDTPFVPEGFGSSWAQYALVLDSQERRDAMQSFLKERGIPTMVYYPRPLHLQPAFAQKGASFVSLEVSERLSRNILCLPMHPYLTREVQDDIVDALTSFGR